jgi:hypothetical protein
MARTVIPKEDPQRRNKHTELVLDRRDGSLIGPELSWTIDWNHKTREWWDAWRRSAIAPMLEETDWEELENTALIHHNIWGNPKLSVAQMAAALAEIRQRVAKYGATYEDRLKLRIKFADASIKEDQANPLQQIKKQNIAEMFADEEVVEQ